MADSNKKTVYGIGWSVLFKIVLFCDTIYEIKRLDFKDSSRIIRDLSSRVH